MLITIWGMPHFVCPREGTLKQDIAVAVSGLLHTTVRVHFSPTPIRAPGHEGSVRILPTGLDVRGYESKVVRIVGNILEANSKDCGYRWYGFEHPHLAGQKK